MSMKLSKFFEPELVPGDSVLIGLTKSAACMDFVIAKVIVHEDYQSIALLPLSNGYDIFMKWLPRGSTLSDFMKAHDRYMEYDKICDDPFRQLRRVKSIKSGTILADEVGKTYVVYKKDAHTWQCMSLNNPLEVRNTICCDDELNKENAINLLKDLNYYYTCDVVKLLE